MNTQQQNKLTTYYNIRSICKAFQPVWEKNVAFSASLNLFTSKLPLIEHQRELQIVDNSGATTEKDQKRANLDDRTNYMINRLESFGNATNNTDLLHSISYSTTAIKSTRDNQIAGIANIIVAKAKANLAAAANYGITDALINDLQNAVNQYTDVVAKPSVAAAQVKAATQALAVLFRETDAVLNNRLKLDIEMFKISNPDFYSQFQTACQIIKTRPTTLSLLVTTKDADSNESLKNVVLTIAPLTNTLAKATNAKAADTNIITKKTTEKGNARFIGIANGTYLLTAEKPGCEPTTQQVVINKGEKNNIALLLKKQ